MGEELFRDSRLFRALESRIDHIAGFSVRETCLRGDEDMLRRTEFTQPCLYVVNALHHEKLSAQMPPPDFLAGHSLGEINALQAAGAFDLLTGLRLVVRRGRLMAEQRGGAMAAVIGLDAGTVASALIADGHTAVDIANLNTPEQVVVSGPADAIAKSEETLLGAGARAFVPLPVGAAFHSRSMEAAAKAFEAFLRDMPLRPLRRTVISNVTAEPYPTNGTAEALVSLLGRQLREAVRWSATIDHLRRNHVTRFVEVGPGRVLTNML